MLRLPIKRWHSASAWSEMSSKGFKSGRWLFRSWTLICILAIYSLKELCIFYIERLKHGRVSLCTVSDSLCVARTVFILSKKFFRKYFNILVNQFKLKSNSQSEYYRIVIGENISEAPLVLWLIGEAHQQVDFTTVCYRDTQGTALVTVQISTMKRWTNAQEKHN